MLALYCSGAEEFLYEYMYRYMYCKCVTAFEVYISEHCIVAAGKRCEPLCDLFSYE